MNVCVDASLVIKWLTPEEGSTEAWDLYKSWSAKSVQLVAPSILDYEIGSTIRKKILRQEISPDDLFSIFDLYRKTEILLFHLSNLVPQAVSAAATLSQPTIYDVSYLLIAQQQNADFVTADKRFFEAASPIFPFVKFYGNSERDSS